MGRSVRGIWYSVSWYFASMPEPAVMITWVLQTWPEVPWDAVQYVGVGLMILLPIVFYPFARSLFLSAHLYIHPTGDTDR